MKKIVFSVFCLSLVLLLARCATLTPGGQLVQIVDSSYSVKNCTLIQQVRVETALSGTGESAGREDLRIKIRNKAAELGGDVVVVRSEQREMAGLSMTGDVYKCGK